MVPLTSSCCAKFMHPENLKSFRPSGFLSSILSTRHTNSNGMFKTRQENSTESRSWKSRSSYLKDLLLCPNESNQISFCVSLTSHLLIFKANVQFDCVWPNNEIYMFKTLSKYLWTFEDSGHKVLAGYGPRKPSENFPSQVPIKVPGKGPKFSLGGIMPRHGNLVPTSWSTGFVGWSIILSYLTLSNHWERLQLTRLKNKRVNINLLII